MSSCLRATKSLPVAREKSQLISVQVLENGVFASIDASWSRPPYWPTWGGLTFEMITDRGAIIVDAFRQNLTVHRHEWQRAGWSYWGSDANQAMVNEFVAALQEDRQPRVSGVDGLKATEVVEAAYASAESGQPINISE